MLVQRRMPMTDFDRFFSPVGVESPERTNDVKPRVRVSDLDDMLHFTIELPGVDKSTMKLLVNDENVMTISGEREIEKNENEKMMINEFDSVSYKRSFIIPTKYETDNIEASFKNGLLLVSIPKKETLKPKTINIK